MPKDPNDQILETLADMNQAIGDRFDKVDGELSEIRSQLNRIEDTILAEHARRIEALEHKVGIGRE